MQRVTLVFFWLVHQNITTLGNAETGNRQARDNNGHVTLSVVELQNLSTGRVQFHLFSVAVFIVLLFF